MNAYTYTVMQVAHILIKYDDKNHEISWNDIESLQEIKRIKPTFGVYDAVIEMEAQSKYEVNQIVTEKIKNKPGVHSTSTLLENKTAS